MKPVISVVGSINMDLVVSAYKRPSAGETILGKDFQTVPGGKGANQAVALSRLGAEVNMIGRVGEDELGSNLMRFLEKENIVLNSVESVTDVSSGVAVITLAEQDNSIIVVQGANEYVTPGYVQKFEEQIAKSDVVLAQLEIPIESVEETARLCHKHNTTFILDPAPAQELSPLLLDYADYMTPNQSELTHLSAIGEMTLEQYPNKLIVTGGKDGIAYFDGSSIKRIPSLPVTVLDTTGAGDTFNGAFGYAISKKKDVHAACKFANAAAALSVKKMGAQGGMPTIDEVRDFLCINGKERVAEWYCKS
ncbi:ribokinase [Virgibacillus sp. NKC19-3]|uniref:ribokinase n=1 Tax=Virgibacillus saliphilus TaxID=2831674 RepID=UPI001C9A3DB0|nr:ribokinase [Virgibacillus sp. NKC19-3]MBY7144466.1 ribokinase [Virgibacillus sp. NKC19-3]